MSFATTWIATAIWSLRSPDLVAFIRISLRVAGGLTIALPLLSFTLFGWQEASSGVVARVNTSLLLVGVATLLGTRAIRRQETSRSPEPTDLAPLPAGGPTRAQSLAATLGAILVAALTTSLTGLMPDGPPIDGVTIGVLVFPIAWLAMLFWALLAPDLRTCMFRVGTVATGLGVALAFGLA